MKRKVIKIKLFYAVIIICLLIAIVSSIIITRFASEKETGAWKALTSEDINSMKVIPTLVYKSGIDVKSKFKIECPKYINEGDLREVLSVKPQQGFKLAKVSPNSYLLSLMEGMSANKIYNVVVKNSTNGARRSWAFQTKSGFSIVSSTPRDKGTEVLLDSGIEINFSKEISDDLSDFTNYFNITPSVKGKFEKHYKTMVFIPQGLKKSTVYTVTIKKGLTLKGTDESLSEDYVFSFQTETNRYYYSNEFLDFNLFNDLISNFTSKDIPVIEVWASEGYAKKDFDVQLYKYKDDTEYINDIKKYDSIPDWVYYDGSEIEFNTNNLDMASSFKSKLYNKDSGFWHTSFLIFPEKLKEGYYLVNIKCDGKTYQRHMQVNDTAAYVMSDKVKTLVWSNNAATGDVLVDADVEQVNGETQKTGLDGVAILNNKTDQTDRYSYIKIHQANRPSFVARVLGYDKNVTDSGDLYWSYLYLDKGLYLPTDTIRLWGIARPRDKTVKYPEKGVLKIYKSVNYGEEEGKPIITKELNISEMGTFTTQIDIENYLSDSYRMEFETDGKLLSESYFDVRQYYKPSYRITAKEEKKSVFVWDKVGIDIEAAFFEGSPVSNLSLSVSSSESNKNRTVVTDSQGKAQINISPVERYNSWKPERLDYQIGNNYAEDQEINVNGSVNLFPRDIMIEVDAGLKSGKGEVKVRTHKIDISKIKDEDTLDYEPEQYRGNAVDIKLKAEVYEESWKAEVIGSFYDVVNKKTVKEYNYTPVKHLVRTYNFTTLNGEFGFGLDLDKSKYYKVVVIGKDSRGKKITQEESFWPKEDPQDSIIKYYEVVNESNKESYKLGETANVRLECNGLLVKKAPKARVLYMKLRDGLVEKEVKSQPEYSFSMNESGIPNSYILAAYFDGKNIYESYPLEILYDYSEKKLNLEVKTDKISYKPGDTVNLDITAKDSEGKPAIAEVNVSAVDEAFFAVQDQTVDLSGELYNDSYTTGIISSFISYRQYNLKDGSSTAEEGGEGGDEFLRMNFKDNSVFRSVLTNSQGKAQLSFKLPDNLTSWRLTYQGITKDLYAGNGRINIETKLPYFIDVISSSTYLTGDTASLILRSFGTSLKNSDKVNYEVTLKEDTGAEKKYSTESVGNRPVNLKLGSLSTGNYSVIIKGQSGNYKDGIEKDIKVVDNILEASVSKYFKLNNGIRIEAGSPWTTITFCNDSSTVFYNALNSLRFSCGERIDQKIARKLSGELLKQYFSKDKNVLPYFNIDESFDFSRYQTEDGGIALLSYGSSDPLLSAKICSVDPKLFDQNALEGYFTSVLDKKNATAQEVAASYWGLAAINRPVLLDVYKLLENPEKLNLKEKLYLGLALADLGDSDGANKVFDKYAAPNMKKADPLAFIDTQSSRDDIVETTAAASLLAMKVNNSEGKGLMDYVMQNSTQEILTNLEQLIYICNNTPLLNNACSFAYNLNGKSEKIVLDNQEIYTMTLNKEDIKNISFRDVSGKIGVITSTLKPVSFLTGKGNKLVKINRAYYPNVNSFKQSEIIKVMLTPQFNEAAPDGAYEITDILPAGFRFVKSFDEDYDEVGNWYFTGQEGQKVTFVYNYSKKEKKGAVTYSARAVSTGEFTAENAIIKHVSSDTMGVSEKSRVRIVVGASAHSRPK